MTTKLTVSQALDQFVELAERQRLVSIKGMTTRQAKTFIKILIAEALPKRTFGYLMTPQLYLENFAETMRVNQLPIAIELGNIIKYRFNEMDTLSKSFFLSMIVYFTQCRLHSDILPEDLTAELNYFTKVFNSEKLLDGPFEKIPSTFFGTRPLKLFELSLPDEHDFLVAYNRHGVLTAMMYYQGQGFINYTPGTVITDFFAKK